jgi:hypothetical protein
MAGLDDLMAGYQAGPKQDALSSLMLPSHDPAAIPRQGWQAAKGIANAMLIEPGWELGGTLQRIMEGQAAPKDYFEAGTALPGVGAVKGLAAAAGKFTPAIFAGVMAKTANKAALSEAERLAAKGATREQIWNDTGWFKGADDKWRFEIPDQASAFSPGAHRQVRPMGEVLDHPELYDAYPDMRAIKTQTWAKPEEGFHQAALSPRLPSTENIRVPTKDFKSPDSARSVTLHEGQHAVQTREGFAEGANPADPWLRNRVPNPEVEVYNNLLKTEPRLANLRALEDSDAFNAQINAKNAIYMEKYKPRLAELEGQTSAAAMRKKEAILKEAMNEFSSGKFPLIEQRMQLIGDLQKDRIPFYPPNEFLTADQAYRRHAGEVEARNVMKRRDYTPEQRKANPPWTTEDTPQMYQLMRGVNY